MWRCICFKPPSSVTPHLALRQFQFGTSEASVRISAASFLGQACGRWRRSRPPSSSGARRGCPTSRPRGATTCASRPTSPPASSLARWRFPSAWPRPPASSYSTQPSSTSRPGASASRLRAPTRCLPLPRFRPSVCAGVGVCLIWSCKVRGLDVAMFSEVSARVFRWRFFLPEYQSLKVFYVLRASSTFQAGIGAGLPEEGLWGWYRRLKKSSVS